MNISRIGPNVKEKLYVKLGRLYDSTISRCENHCENVISHAERD